VLRRKTGAWPGQIGEAGHAIRAVPGDDDQEPIVREHVDLAGEQTIHPRLLQLVDVGRGEHIGRLTLVKSRPEMVGAGEREAYLDAEGLRFIASTNLGESIDE
jgi:hypothetical protein